MNTQEYLSQAFKIDRQIDSKLAQIASLRVLAEKTNILMSDLPGSPTRKTDKMEEAVIKIVNLENEINGMIDEFIDLKVEISRTVFALDDMDCRTVLELRYLCFLRWEDIADKMKLGLRTVYRLHKKALKKLKLGS